MKIGGENCEIDWKEFGPGPDSADSLHHTEIERAWKVGQTAWTDWWDIRYFASKVVIPEAGSYSMSLYFKLTTSDDRLYFRVWYSDGWKPGGLLAIPGHHSGPFPAGWYKSNPFSIPSGGTYWIGGYLDLGHSGEFAYRLTGGNGLCGKPSLGAPWNLWPERELRWKMEGGLFQVELEGEAGAYAEDGTFTSGVVDLGLGIKLNSMKWESEEPSPTSIDTVPPPPKTVSVRASNIAPTIAKGGGAWTDKDVPDLEDPEWGGDAGFNLIATISVGNAPRGVACDESVGKTFVANRTSSVVSVIHTASNTISATIGVGTNPEGIVCDETAAKTFVTNSGSNSVSVIHTASNTISATISVGNNPSGIDCDEVIGKTFVANGPPLSTVIYTTKDSYINKDSPNTNYGGLWYLQNEHTGFTSLRESCLFFPIGIGTGIESAVLRVYCYGSDDKQLRIRRVTENWEEDLITWNNQPAVTGDYGTYSAPMGWLEMDLTTLVLEWDNGTYPNYGISFILVGDGRAHLYSREGTYPPELALTYQPTVSVIDTTSNTISATINVGITPWGISCDEIVGKTFVSNSGDDTVSVIHTTSDTISATISVGTTPQGIGCDETLGKTFVANYGSNTVSVIHTASNTISATINVGTNPHAIICDEGAAKTFVMNTGNDCVTVIDSSTNFIRGTVSIGDSPYGIDCDETAGKVFGANSGDNTVSVFSDVEEIAFHLPYSEYESEHYVDAGHRKRYAQFRAKLWSDVS